MFAGNMGVLQGLDNLVHAAQRLPHDASILIAMVGDGMDLPRLKQLVIELQLTERVRFVERNRRPPWRDTSRPRTLSSFSSARLRLPDFSIPAKTIAYLAAGKPIVVASTGTAAEVVSAAQAGIVVPPDDPDRLAQAFVHMSRMNPDERARIGHADGNTSRPISGRTRSSAKYHGADARRRRAASQRGAMSEPSPGRTVLMTGATGALGPAVIRAFRADRWRIRTLSRTPPSPRTLAAAHQHVRR